MHRSLSVCEVLRIICQHFLESSALGSLAALGTVCRAFSDPAFDVLWSEQTSLEPIVGCIQAPDLWKQKNVSLSRPVRSSDLTRFSYYSRRVKIYRQRRITTGIDPFLTSGLFSTLQTIAPQSLCFPNIHTFEWSGVGKSYEWLPLFLGPLVTSITLHLGSGPCHPWLPLSILPRLTSQYPSMKQATITFVNPEPQQHGPTRIRSVSDAVTGWNHLRSLTVDGLDGSGWLHLPTLTRLKVLNVGKIDEEVIPLLRDNAKDHGRGFATLRELRVGTSRLEACVQLARYFSRSPLQTFIVGISHRAPASWWKQLFAIISHGCMSTTLEIIRIHRAANYRSLASPHGPEPTNIEVIVPLFSFPNLSHLELSPSFPFSFDSNTSCRFGVWSRLETLDLGHRLICHELRGLLSLTPFAQHCPCLRSLRIFVDTTTNIPTSLDILRIRQERVSHTNLRLLDLDDSPITKELVFASANFLSLIFPGLENIQTDARAITRDLWAQVVQLVPDVASVRSGEEEFWVSQASVDSLI